MNEGLGATILFHLGPLAITDTVITSWGILLCFALAGFVISRRLKLEPSRWQTACEGIVLTLEGAIAEVIPNEARRVLPFVGTLWLFVLVANLAGLIPGLHAPTRDLSATAALAMLVFFRRIGMASATRDYGRICAITPNRASSCCHSILSAN